jgi:replicative DNA helicase
MIYNFEIEKQLLAGLIKESQNFSQISSFIDASDFYSEQSNLHSAIFTIIKQAITSGDEIDEIIIAQRVNSIGLSFEDNLNPSDYIKSLALRKVPSGNLIKTAKELKKFSIRREILASSQEMGKAMKSMSPESSYQQIIECADAIYNAKINLYEIGKDVPENIYADMEDIIEERGNNPITEFGMMGPHPKVNEIYGSLLRPGNITVIVARSGVGKMNPLYTKVLTPSGFVEMREIDVGSQVVCPSGKTANVISVFNHQQKDIYRVYLEDGRFVDCGIDHLWKVYIANDKGQRNWVVSNTKNIINDLKQKGQNIYLPLVGEIDYERDSYYSGRYSQRMELLLALLDINPAAIKADQKNTLAHGFFEFSTKSEDLAKSVQKLAWSLGGISKLRCHLYSHITKGNVEKVKVYSVSIQLKDYRGSLQSKFATDESGELIIEIKKIEKLKTKEDCRCIEIDDEEHLYVVDDFVVTHNTQFCMHYATKVSEKYNVPVLHFDNGEMSKEELVMRQCAALSGVPMHLIESGNWRRAGQEIVDKVRSVWAKIKNLQFYYYNVGGMDVDSMIETLKRFYYLKVGRGNQMIFSFDYIKTTSESNAGKSEWQTVGEMVDKFKKCIQKEILEDGNPVIPMITSVQSNRSGITNNRMSANVIDDESVVSLSDRITQFCSHMFILRNKTADEIQTEGTRFGTHKLINVKSRHLGKDIAGAVEPVRIGDTLRKNFVNLEFANFNIAERGDLRDIARTLDGDEELDDTDNNDQIPNFDRF